MPKMKTHKGAAARFKLTGKGRLRRGQQNNQHGFVKKTNSQKRRLDHDVDVSPANLKNVKRLLGL